MSNLNNSNIIKNISFNQSEILYNIMQLYNEGKPFDCDITASTLNFYKAKKNSEYAIPEPKLLFDVSPQFDNIVKLNPFGPIPIEDNSISSIVIDLPFVISPSNAPSFLNNREGSSLIAKRFASYYPVDTLYESYYHWIKEAYRVLKENGICIFKCQNTVSGGIQHNVEEYSYMAAEHVGFTAEDKFILLAKARLISNAKYKKQVHARKYSSSFWVFKKELKEKSTKFNYFEIIDKISKRDLSNGYYKLKEKNK